MTPSVIYRRDMLRVLRVCGRATGAAADFGAGLPQDGREGFAFGGRSRPDRLKPGTLRRKKGRPLGCPKRPALI